MSVANLLEGLAVGDYGSLITITFKDADGNVQDISSYTTSQIVYVQSPDGRKLVTCTGSFVTDGSDGQLKFAFANGDLDRDGTWKAVAKLTSSTAVKRSQIFEIEVEERIGT